MDETVRREKKEILTSEEIQLKYYPFRPSTSSNSTELARKGRQKAI
jgi:hypothetical protein